MPPRTEGHLRAVDPNSPEPPPKPSPRKVPATITAALDGSSRDVLAAMRKALAKRLDKGEVSSNAISSAYKELRELDRLIRAADEAEEAEAANRDGNAGTRRSFDSSAI